MKILHLTGPTVAVSIPVTSRWSWLWLVIGMVLLPFTSIQPSLAIAAWLAPLFLLRFVRTQRARVGLPVLALLQSLAFGVNWYIGSTPNIMLPLSGVGVGLLATLAYVADRLLTPRLRGLSSILVFPLALTTIDLLGSLLAPALTSFLLPSLFAVAGAWDSPGYTQAGIAPLVQLVSITGMWGLTFLLAWFASTANTLWEHGFDLRRSRSSLVAFGAVCGAVLIFGTMRIAAPNPAAPTVRVAAIASRDNLFPTISDLSPGDLMPGTTAQRANARGRLAPIADDLFVRTERAARDGAKIITWGEAGAPVLEEDAPALIARAATLARQQSIYLQVGLVVFRNSDRYPFLENRAVLLDPTGATAWDYHKAHPTPGENMMIVAGPRTLPVVDTPYGRLAIAICYDVDFPDLIRQAGQAGADILLAPYKDWESIRVQHAQMALFRAVENGFAIVRPALSGISTIIDAQGRVLVQADAFGPGEPTAVANVATQRATTLYARFGDWFAYLCVVCFAALTMATLLPRRSLRGGQPHRCNAIKEQVMNRIVAFVNAQALAIFCALTIALSFAATQLPLPGEIVPVVMVFVPTLVALNLTATTDGWNGVRALGSKLGQWRVRPKWVVIALALGLVLRMTMSGIAVALELISAIQLRPWTPMQLAIFAVMLFIFAIPEELGWRGYALPKLLTAHSPLVASLIIGVAWGSLHLALHFPGMIYAGAPLLPTFLEVIALSVAMTWLFIRSGGNILLMSLFHAAQSFFVIVNEGIPLEQQAWLMASVYVVAALIIAIVAGPRFARKPTVPVATRPGQGAGQPIEAAPTAYAAARTSFGDEHYIA